MMTEEDVIALIVQSDDASASKLGIMRKHAGKHPSNTVPKTGIEIVQYYFRVMAGTFANTLQQTHDTISQQQMQ